METTVITTSGSSPRTSGTTSPTADALQSQPLPGAAALAVAPVDLGAGDHAIKRELTSEGDAKFHPTAARAATAPALATTSPFLSARPATTAMTTALDAPSPLAFQSYTPRAPSAILPLSKKERQRRAKAAALASTSSRTPVPARTSNVHQPTPHRATAGFGSTSPRFTVAGAYPRSLRPGTCITAAAYRVVPEERQRGPGSHHVETDPATSHFNKRLEKESAWSLEANHPQRRRLEASSQLQARRKASFLDSTRRGPGTYPLTGMETMHSRRVPMSLNRPGPRYQPENQFQSSVPGPVEYGDATTRMDEYAASLRHPGRRGLLDAVRDEVHSAFPPPKPGPSPSQYQKVEVRPVKPASKIGANGLHDLSREPRGPCNFTTGPRFPSSADRIGLAPGQYGIPEANLSTTHRVPVIEFSETARFPKKPTDYYGLHHLAHLPRPAEDPGPGHYTGPLVEPRPATHHGGRLTPRKTVFDDMYKQNMKDVTGPGMRAGTGALPMTGKQSTANLSSTLPRFRTAGQNDEYMMERLRCGSR